ncbi:exporter of polyketide antibiotics-like protein [Alkalihalobacillus alcalophilus ATCC 27647 = CGMCC 1.3604]|uniref:ABC transporter permease n=1 Tax=Alkalihalobacillus alcalophilus ATCC 27647 = CGMCC 1.3604 TaxID=1218173 RepID=J8TUP0_ALKAL|nr:ABC-2 transporter permease [Alkalihalobacillus alcalophilus]AFV25710.1 multidrug transporter [Alkalihalobacillus alcalophilus ATCC 27647 = CGMCC 1.3604]KGA98929.1 ABC transporter permease [Alkalihalobacillus alcalophilus ATCC 27647 = CGMCC 1.3604]MED1561961.1 ABC-2 transporter permease [Alkalihalobacillus alcalophilus]THG89548.1 exporter of polyketide antibiotics-like protein [Alkalihalobacillus alcalophilus ATCC 27647 = CGMCC 1.3604]
MYSRLFKGTVAISKLMVKQQRLKILFWLLGIVGITLAAAASYPSIYPDEQSKQAFALTMENPAMKAMVGSGYDLADVTNVGIGVIFSYEMLLFTAIAVAIMSILLVSKSTRADEEDGRTEMIGSLPVGRLAYLSAATLVLLLTNGLLVLLTGIGLGTLGIEGIDFSSSFLYSLVLGTTGLLFGSFAILFAQLAETSKGTVGLSFAFLIGTYLVRAIGDVGNETVSLFSPLGWTVRTSVFLDNNWWPVFLLMGVAIIVATIGFFLNAIRDIDSGFLPVKKGNKHASRFLQTPIGLALRLQRTNIIAWAIGLFVLSATFGSILGELETYFVDLEIMQAFIPEDSSSTMTEQFVTLLMAIMSLFSAIPAVMVVLKLKGEENKNRMEYYYSRALSRTKVLGSYYVLAIVVSMVMQLLLAVGLWSVGSTVMDKALSFGSILGAALVYLPAIWVVVGLAILLVGLVPKVTAAIWAYIVYGFIVVYLGDLLDFPGWMKGISVFEYVPQIPVDEMNVWVMILLVIVAKAITICGFIFYRKRDIAG